MTLIVILLQLFEARVKKGMGLAQQNEQLLVSQGMELSDSEDKFRAFIEGSSVGFVLADEQGVIVDWNHSMERLLA